MIHLKALVKKKHFIAIHVSEKLSRHTCWCWNMSLLLQLVMFSESHSLSRNNIWSNSPDFLGISWFSIYPHGLPNRIKISQIFQKKKENLIRIPQYSIILCNNFREETKVKRGDSHYVIKRMQHSTTQVMTLYLTRKYFVLRNIILWYVPFFIFWIHCK